MLLAFNDFLFSFSSFSPLHDECGRQFQFFLAAMEFGV